MLPNDALPPEYDAFLAELANESEDVRALWRYAIVLFMIDNAQARILETEQAGDLLYLRVQTRAGDRFVVTRPNISDEKEQALLENVRMLFNDDVALDGNSLPL